MTKRYNWLVRQASRADDSQLSELYRIVFGMERQTESYTWKFRDNPDGDPVVAVAEDNGKIVGQYALWPTKLRLGSVVVMGAQSLDTMTHPDYRGQGMFPQLAEACMQYAAGRGIQVLYGFPNENSFPGFVRKLDWDCTGNIPIWVRPLRPSRHHRMPRYLGSLADYGAKLLPKGRIHGLRVEMSLPDSDAIGGLLEVWRSRSGRCRVERTYERYMWRFSAKSGMRYRWMCAYDGDSLVAVGVWGIDIRNGNALLSEVLGKSTEAIEAVVSACVRMAAKSDCPIMLAISNCPDTRRALSRTGFIKRGEIPLIVRKITTQTLGANVHTHPLWDIFGADLDTF